MFWLYLIVYFQFNTFYSTKLLFIQKTVGICEKYRNCPIHKFCNCPKHILCRIHHECHRLNMFGIDNILWYQYQRFLFSILLERFQVDKRFLLHGNLNDNFYKFNSCMIRILYFLYFNSMFLSNQLLYSHKKIFCNIVLKTNQ